MELTFLSNKYAKLETTSIRPAVQLKYMGKSYFAEQIKSFRNSVVLTSRRLLLESLTSALGLGPDDAAGTTA